MSILNVELTSDESPLDFKISSKSEAARFENLLQAIHDRHIDCPGKIIFGLDNIYEVCYKFKKEYGGRVFTAIVDLAISQTNCACELDDCIKSWNKYFSDANGTISTSQCLLLDNEQFFEGKFYFQRHLNSFVFKFRAHWDKIMGLYFLIWKYSYYQDFIRSPSKKKMFIKHFKDHKMVDQEIVKYVEDDLKSFDEYFRTHEAHGTGRLRKFAFTNGLEQSKTVLLDLANERYGAYVKLAPKIFQCIEYFMCFPEVVDRLEKTKPNDLSNN